MKILKHLKKITAIVVAVIALVVIILGAKLMKAPEDHVDISLDRYEHTGNSEFVMPASFGADFYTYIYDASYTITGQLRNIDDGLETMVQAQNAANAALDVNIAATNDLNDAVHKVGGTIVLVIGLAILAYAVKLLGGAFSVSVCCEKEGPAVTVPECAVPETAECAAPGDEADLVCTAPISAEEVPAEEKPEETEQQEAE